jgi:hypothetical protein
LGFRTKEVNKMGLTGSGGFGFFKFDPHAKIDGRWVRLQPLGTEGQGLSGNTSGFYKLIQSAKILQLGAYYRVSRSLFIEIQISQYFTSTDFLDDVSGDYFDPEQLRLERGDLAWRLADRHAEVNLGAPNFPQGTPRGNPTKNDQFAYFKIGIGWALSDRFYNMNASNVKCPTISKYW